MKPIALFIIGCFILLSASPSAFAHKVNIYAYVEDDTVFTESYFPDGKKVRNGKISVYDISGRLLLEGVTGADGQFSFKLFPQDSLKIVLDASMGHRDEYVLKVSGERNERERNNPKEARTPLLKALFGIAAIFSTALFARYILKKTQKSGG